jgi:hypothetical protein
MVQQSQIQLPGLDRDSLDAAKQALGTCWRAISTASFNQMCGPFHDTFGSDMLQILSTVIESNFDSPGIADSIENIVGFIVQTSGALDMKERMRVVAKGYWEVMVALSLSFAANSLAKLSAVVGDLKGGAWQILMTSFIEICREAIMTFSTFGSPGWKEVIKRSTFWCLQAELCRRGWAAGLAEYMYRNDQQWEEHRILSGGNEDWILDDIV